MKTNNQETPRTDAWQSDERTVFNTVVSCGLTQAVAMGVRAVPNGWERCKQLERELNAANRELEEYKIAYSKRVAEINKLLLKTDMQNKQLSELREDKKRLIKVLKISRESLIEHADNVPEVIKTVESIDRAIDRRVG